MDDNDFRSKDIEKLIDMWHKEECLWNISEKGLEGVRISVTSMLTKALCIILAGKDSFVQKFHRLYSCV